MKYSIRVSPIIDLEKYYLKGEIVDLSMGYDGLLYILMDKKMSDYTLQIYVFSENKLVLDIEIKKEKLYISSIQPLPSGEILLVARNAAENWSEEFQKNGRVYGKDGILSREIRLGHSVVETQVTNNGTIWAGYGDEGWLGLVAWDISGKQVYKFSPSDGLDHIIHCYALNAVSNNDIWVYYYTDFPLVRLKSYQIEGVWNIPISGSHAFAVSGSKVIFQGGYDEGHLYSVYKLSPKNFFLIKTFEILYEGSGKKGISRVKARGDRFWILRNNKIYSFTVEDALAQLAGQKSYFMGSRTNVAADS